MFYQIPNTIIIWLLIFRKQNQNKSKWYSTNQHRWYDGIIIRTYVVLWSQLSLFDGSDYGAVANKIFNTFKHHTYRRLRNAWNALLPCATIYSDKNIRYRKYMNLTKGKRSEFNQRTSYMKIRIGSIPF